MGVREGAISGIGGLLLPSPGPRHNGARDGRGQPREIATWKRLPGGSPLLDEQVERRREALGAEPGEDLVQRPRPHRGAAASIGLPWRPPDPGATVGAR